MKIQTMNLDKGGGGKTSHTYNEGDWLSRVKNKRTLLIDGARECNLTHSFDVTSEKTIYDIFTTGEYEICRINDSLSLIRGDERLTDEQLDLASRNNKYLQLFMWFSEHYEELAEQFDIILIDTHNDESLVTANFIAVSDVVQEDEAYLGSIQKKELMAKSLVINQSVFEQREQMTPKQKQDHQNFYDNIEYVYENILKVLEREVA